MYYIYFSRKLPSQEFGVCYFNYILKSLLFSVNMGDENEENLIEKVRNLAARAVQHDQLKQLSAAVYFYHEAAKIMDQLHSLTRKDSYQAHGEKYKRRAGTL